MSEPALRVQVTELPLPKPPAPRRMPLPSRQPNRSSWRVASDRASDSDSASENSLDDGTKSFRCFYRSLYEAIPILGVTGKRNPRYSACYVSSAKSRPHAPHAKQPPARLALCHRSIQGWLVVERQRAPSDARGDRSDHTIQANVAHTYAEGVELQSPASAMRLCRRTPRWGNLANAEDLPATWMTGSSH